MKKEIKMRYPPESAGRAMVSKEKLPFFLQNKKISEIRKAFLENLKNYEVCYYIYFVDENERLVGSLSERELFQAFLNIEAKEKTDIVIASFHYGKEYF